MSKNSNLPGTVGVMFSSDSAKYTGFTSDLERLILPEGSVKDFEIGTDSCELRNRLTERALERGSYWIWFITEEHSFEPDVVERLLSRGEPLIAPILLGRNSPFYPECYVGLDESGRYVPLLLNEVTGPGTMVEVRAVSATGMLVRSAVLKPVRQPWFRYAPDGNDFTYFSERAREAGFQPYVDTSVRIGNRYTASLLPIHKGGHWELAIEVGGDISMSQRIRH